nr:copia protein [Tanacetum cinerariifolium]
LITHQGNNQVKDNKIDILVQQYEQFVISKDESIDNVFVRFNTIISSLKALDEEEEDSLDNQGTTKRPFKEAETRKTTRVKRNVLDAVIQIISLENVQNHQKTRTKEHSLEVFGVIAAKKTMKRSKTKHDSRLGHTNIRLIQSLASKELVRNLPRLNFDQHFCDACKIGKQAHASHKAKSMVSTTRCLELLYIDLFGPSTVQSYGGNRYTLFIVDDYSSYGGNHYILFIVDDYSRKIEESLNLTFDETPPPSKRSPLVDDNLDEEEAIKVTEKKNLENDIEDETLEIDEIVNIKESRNHPLENVIEKLNQRTLRSQAHNRKDLKPMKTPMSSDTKRTKDKECESVDSTKYQGMIGLWYTKGTGIETIVYADSDHAGDYVDRKSTSGICTFVGCCLTSWFLKKQTALAISTTEAEYVSARKACQQTLWMKQALIEYDVRLDDVSIMYYNKCTIDLRKNLVQHSAIDHYISYDRVMHPFAPHYERKMRSDHGKKRPCDSNTSSSSTSLNHPSSLHSLDDIVNKNDDESFHSNSSTPSQNVSSSFNVVSRVRQNLPYEIQHLNTYLSKTINLQTHPRDDHQNGLRLIGKALKDMMDGKQK